MLRVIGVAYFSNASDQSSMLLASSMGTEECRSFRLCDVLITTWSSALNNVHSVHLVGSYGPIVVVGDNSYESWHCLYLGIPLAMWSTLIMCRGRE